MLLGRGTIGSALIAQAKLSEFVIAPALYATLFQEHAVMLTSKPTLKIFFPGPFAPAAPRLAYLFHTSSEPFGGGSHDIILDANTGELLGRLSNHLDREATGRIKLQGPLVQRQEQNSN